MTDPRLEDHLVGVELQIVELVEQKERAEVQGLSEDAQRIQREIDALHADLAQTAEKISEEQLEPPAEPFVDAPRAAAMH
jgi:peptidoglycan hydrolase CwlO-like protein